MDTQPFVAAFQEINNRLIRLIGSMSALRELSTLEQHHVDESHLLDASLRILLDNHELDHAVIFLKTDAGLQDRARLGWPEAEPGHIDALMPDLIRLAEAAVSAGGVRQLREIRLDDRDAGSAIALPLVSGDNEIGAHEELSIIDDLTALHNRRFFFPEASTMPWGTPLATGCSSGSRA